MINSKKVLWVHNFPTGGKKGGGWMYNQHSFLSPDVDLYFADKLRNPFNFFKHLIRLRKKAKNYDIVHAQYGSAVGFLTSLVSSKKILSLKGSDWYSSPPKSFLDKLRIVLGNTFTKFSINKFNLVIVMSNRMAKEVLIKYPNIPVEVIVDPIDLDNFVPKERKENKIKKVVFAAVFLNNPVKRFSLAEESFKELQKKMPNTELVTMSKIPHSKVCDFMNDMDAILLTSTHEGWPNVVKEMLACNKPFVSTRVSDLEEFAKQTSNCFSCSDNPKEIADSLFKSLNAPKEDLRKLVLNFNMNETLNKLKSIYEKI